jgi:hypothetical protein
VLSSGAEAATLAPEVTSEPRCYRRHLRMTKICGNGARRWWAQHGFNWPEFLQDGIAGETLLGTNDPFAQRVVEAARTERDG